MAHTPQPAAPDLFDDLNLAQQDPLSPESSKQAVRWKPAAMVLAGLLVLNALGIVWWFLNGDPARPSAADRPLAGVAEQRIVLSSQQPMPVGQLTSAATSGGAGSASSAKQGVLPPSAVPPAATPNVAAVAAVKSGLCAKWGLFNAAESKRAERRLAKQGWAGYTSEAVDEGVTYMVFVGSYDTKAQLDKKMKELKAQGVKDFSLIANNSLSLGVVATEEAAQALKAQLNRKGVKGVQITERNRGLQRTRFVFEQLTPAYRNNLIELAEGLGSVTSCDGANL